MKKKRSNSTTRRLLEYAGQFKGTYIASLVLAIMGVACKLVPYFSVSKIIILLLGGTRNFDEYLRWLGVILIGQLGNIVFHYTSTTLSHKATFSLITVFRKRLTEKLSKVSLGYSIETPSGKFKNIIVEKVDGIEPTLAHVLPEMTSNLLVPFVIITYIFILDWRMGFASLITLPLGIICYMGMMKDYDKKYGVYQKAAKDVSNTSVEYVNGIEVIKAFSQSQGSYEKFKNSATNYAKTAEAWMGDVQKYYVTGLGIWPAVFVGVLPIGFLLWSGGTLAADTFITIAILSLGIMQPLITAITYTDDLAKVFSTMTDIVEVLDENEIVRPNQKVNISNYMISLKDVSFSYDKEEVLHNINLNINYGEVTALVGPSGSGKSTIGKLIASFWDIDKGIITIGGIDTKQIPLPQIMDLISYVSQDNYLFNDTIRNNIRIGKPETSDEEVENIAKQSGCHDFIMSLENGYDTIVGDGGGHLSGGERQRITIARAMLKDAPIVILDEATAYTDPENEAVIQKAVSKLVSGKTLIIIAHRLSTITNSDKIVVINDGEIESEGAHSELLESCELYNNMWQSHNQYSEAV